ncbi:SDR family NAD(P)-dependent oxidoreductase [Pseudonocardia phyllosphaerae]|uniref:SDR family NAD(P)-dependent oxidoreductase n=1 Tax=Pseudonocardia phyllosphaerae TaxID=3390502 RepID=UPI00397B949B
MSENRRVLVTGARRGIGYAIARRLANDGYRVTGIDLLEPETPIDGADFHICDLTDTEATSSLIGSLAEEQPFYGLVNNAALFSADRSVLDTTVGDMRASSDLHLTAPLICAQAMIPGMRALGSGRIVNISSRAALGKANRTAYAATKSGVIGMSRTWALELAPLGITVNVVAPGMIETESTPADDPEAQANVAVVPLQRFGTPAELAHAVAFLMTDLSGFITGQTLFVDGGRTIGSLTM